MAIGVRVIVAQNNVDITQNSWKSASRLSNNKFYVIFTFCATITAPDFYCPILTNLQSLKRFQYFVSSKFSLYIACKKN